MSRRHPFASASWVGGFALCCFVTVGCAPDGPRPVACSGTVHVEGEPVDAAMLMFAPVEGEGHPYSTSVKDGEFAFDEQSGPHPGRYAVGIYSEPAPLEAIVEADRDRTHASVRRLRAELGSRLSIEPDASQWSVEIRQDQTDPMELRWPPES